MRHVIEKEKQRFLDYAEEVIEESKGVRPLYPILKAVQVFTSRHINLFNVIIRIERVSNYWRWEYF